MKWYLITLILSISLLAANTGGALSQNNVKAKSSPRKNSLEVSGKRSKSEIERVIKQRGPQFKHLLSKYKKRFPDLFGTITMSWDIAGNGAVLGVKMVTKNIRSLDYDDEMEDFDEEMHNFQSDLKQKIQKWKFPIAKDKNEITKVTYTFEIK